MSFTKVKQNLSQKVIQDSHSWVAALEEAKKQLGEGKLSLAKLRAAVRFFEQKVASGESWPGEKA